MGENALSFSYFLLSQGRTELCELFLPTVIGASNDKEFDYK